VRHPLSGFIRRTPRRRRPSATLPALLVVIFTFAATTSPAFEGKWTPEQLRELDAAWLREIGLELPPEAFWGADGAGLLEAAISIGGCSAGFVSADGLVATNHHCAFGLLQQHSTPERDLIEHGFLAGSRAEELHGEGTRAVLPHRTRDVSADVAAAIPAGADDLARFRAIERRSSQLVAECERQPNRRCRVAAYDGGVRFTLHESIEYPDVRVVYAPPRAVGEYGGEVDNYAWPRHTGDFALLRVWADEGGGPAQPGKGVAGYRPRHFFPVSAEGVRPGDLVLVAGYPGVTFRAETAAELGQRVDRLLPGRAELLRHWTRLLETAAGGAPAARIAVATRVKSLANLDKRSSGQHAGAVRGRMVAERRTAEEAVLAWAAERPEQAAAVSARQELAALVASTDATFDRDLLLGHLRQGPLSLDLALRLVRWAKERQKPDAEREPEYMERNRPRLLETIRVAQKRLYLPAEEALVADFLRRSATLPAGSRIAAADALLAAHAAAGETAAGRAAAALHAMTRVTSLDDRLRMFEETPEELRARRDPLLDFAFALDEELLAQKERDDRKAGAISRLRPVWRRAVAAHAERPIAPDANGTLRVTLGRVTGYSPRDGVLMTPQTTVRGLVEKHTGEEPFAAPAFVLAAAPRSPASRWADPGLGDVPVAFLADADTSGGSSGSPVLDARGRLVGLNFDRVWEAIASDFGFDDRYARNVSVDVRYLLWALEAAHGEAARPLLEELGVAGVVGPSAAAGAAEPCH
jgi:hypothetical protein